VLNNCKFKEYTERDLEEAEQLRKELDKIVTPFIES
jgi:hypothetical protein